MKIKVKNLLPNPFRNIDTYPIDREKISQLRNSIRETTFWDNILARPAPKDGKYEIAYGHHRLRAIEEELGKETVVDIPVRHLSDENMLRIMANENMEQWATDWRVIVETIKQAKGFLEKNTDIAKKYGARDISDVGTPTISSFLGRNWGTSTIKRGLQFLRDRELKSATLRSHGTIEKVGHRIIEEIISIEDREAKKEWLEKIEDKNISYIEAEEIRRFENEPALDRHDKQIIRENILEGRIRGREQIREQMEFIKVRKLQEAKETEEDKRKEELKDFINRTNELAVGLNNKLEVLVAQFKEYPETKKYLPREETTKFSRSLTTLLVTIRQLIDITRGTREERKKELKA